MLNLQTKLKYLDLVKVYSIFSALTWPHPSTHPTTHIPTHGWGSLHRCWIFKQNWNISIRSRYIQFLVIWPDPTHPWVGSLHRCWIFKQNWNISIRSRYIRFFSDLTWPHPSTHPYTHTPTHGWGSHHRCQIFKQNWNISIRSKLTEFLLKWAPHSDPILS